MFETMQIPIVERYQRVLEISRDLASTLNLDTLLGRIVKAAADLCDSQAASILLYDSSKNRLYFEAATNLEEPMRRGIEVPVENSIAGWIVTNRLPMLVNNVHDNPHHFDQVARKTRVLTDSLLGVPLINKNKVIGVLEVINKQSGEFNDEDQDILTTLGAQAAVAIENARLFQQSDMLSELMHEFRAPLSMMQTAAQLFMRPEISEQQRQRVGEIMLKETQRLAEMTASYLDLARLESGRMQFHMEKVNVPTMFAECLAMVNGRALEQGLEMSLQISEELPALKGDPNRLKQVLINLFSNAIKYTPPPGKISTKVYAEQKNLIIAVSDTGVGIPVESLPHMFEKFYRVPTSERMAHGVGLGLPICKRIVEAHGGWIDVKSEMGVGSTFSVVLPLAD
ncbi:MAG: ATP-binding protein [Chloroflexota bacterium]